MTGGSTVVTVVSSPFDDPESEKVPTKAKGPSMGSGYYRDRERGLGGIFILLS